MSPVVTDLYLLTLLFRFRLQATCRAVMNANDFLGIVQRCDLLRFAVDESEDVAGIPHS